uniref:Nucleotide binding protein n=1 Tax=uncultured marine thaumarchaeote KM3_06_B06 TaxID=1455974 RepID=A0A075G9J9_9ARCH|nr:nucleotide binding protein [uncultured marine thaumarchaeote KM3_06_B06]
MVFRVLDSSAFYAGIPFSSNEPSYITSLIYNEIEHIKKDHDAIRILIETKRLTIRDPEHRFVIIANDAAKKSGDFPNLSDEDISSIALSLQLKGELVTDDFAVSNVAKNINIKVIPVMTDGIKNVVTWRYYCPGCEFDNYLMSGTNKTRSRIIECPRCGSKLKRKPIKK